MAPSGRFSLTLRGILRFVALLAAACLVGALVGLITEPLEPGDRANARGTRDAGTEPRATASVPIEDPATPRESIESATNDSDTVESAATRDEGKDPSIAPARATKQDAFASLSPDLRGLYVGCGALAVFVLLAVLLAKRGSATRAGNGVIHVVDTLHLGGGRRIHLLRCEGRKYLISNTEKGVAFLASVPQNDVERAFDAEVAATPVEEADAVGEPGFSRFLEPSLARSAAR